MTKLSPRGFSSFYDLLINLLKIEGPDEQISGKKYLR